MIKIKRVSYLFLCKSVASSNLANLMTFLVTTGSAFSTVVFSLTTGALSASFPLFLGWFLLGVCLMATR